jgi:hypothetical protein
MTLTLSKSRPAENTRTIATISKELEENRRLISSLRGKAETLNAERAALQQIAQRNPAQEWRKFELLGELTKVDAELEREIRREKALAFEEREAQLPPLRDDAKAKKTRAETAKTNVEKRIKDLAQGIIDEVGEVVKLMNEAHEAHIAAERLAGEVGAFARVEFDGRVKNVTRALWAFGARDGFEFHARMNQSGIPVGENLFFG